MLTFVAIILGTVAAGWLAEAFVGSQQFISGLALVAVAVLGVLSSLRIMPVAAAAPTKPFSWNFPQQLWRQFRRMWADTDLWRANLGNTAFFFISALVQLNLTLYAKFQYHLSSRQQSWLQAALCLGIGAGSLVAGKISRGTIRYGLVPVGALIMGVCALGMSIPGLERSVFTVLLGFLGFGGGLFIVPVAAVLQHRPASEDKGSVQGAASWLSWVGILVAVGVGQLLCGPIGMTHGGVFGFCGLVALAVAAYAWWSRKSISTSPQA
jgi:acyl-[acyl-carrier-protein]-phospholipid O-acyltransferase/long-chain-fatty-acid--[acyl-carrier-protein] ligase